MGSSGALLCCVLCEGVWSLTTIRRVGSAQNSVSRQIVRNATNCTYGSMVMDLLTSSLRRRRCVAVAVEGRRRGKDEGWLGQFPYFAQLLHLRAISLPRGIDTAMRKLHPYRVSIQHARRCICNAFNSHEILDSVRTSIPSLSSMVEAKGQF